MLSLSLLEREKSKTGYNGFNLRVENLMIWVEESKKFRNHTPKKAILKGINTEFKEGTITAIVGPSGSGKTTFLNFLACRQNNSQIFKNYCDYYLNNTKILDVNAFKNIIGYVLQEDIMEFRNTPRQLFTYYAKLRGHADPAQTAQKVIDAMYLRKCADTVVGDIFHRGLSGGEKKRTSIGIELVSEPNLLFLDEPTTGLDSTTALDIVMNITELKKKGMTIICTIHQPSEEIMALFDNVVMLVDGHLIYNDAPFNIMSRLNSIGFHKNQFETPIEFFMKIVDKDDIRILLDNQFGKIDEEEVTRIHAERIEQLLEVQNKIYDDDYEPLITDPAHLSELQQLANTKNQPISFTKQFWLIFIQYTNLFFTEWRGIILKSFMYIMIFALIIIVFVKSPSVTSDPVSLIQNRGGFYFMYSINIFMGTAGATSTVILPVKPIFLKDRQSRLYSPLAFFTGASLHVLPFLILMSTITGIAEFFIFNLNFTPQISLLWYWAFSMVAILAGTSMGLLISAMADKFEDMGALMPIIVLPMALVSGFFANILTITWPLRIYSYLSPIRFIFQGLVLNEFVDTSPYLTYCKVSFNCLNNPSQTCYYNPIPGTTLSSFCNPFVRFNFEQTSIWLNFVIAIILVFGWRFIAFLLFVRKYRERLINYSQDQEYFDKYAKGGSKARESKLNRESMRKGGVLNTEEQVLMRVENSMKE